MDWNWRMREKQVSRVALGYSHEKEGEPDTEMAFQPPHSYKTTGSESGNEHDSKETDMRSTTWNPCGGTRERENWFILQGGCSP